MFYIAMNLFIIQVCETGMNWDIATAENFLQRRRKKNGVSISFK